MPAASQFFDVTYKLRGVLSRKTAGGPEEIDFMNWVTRAALEIVAQSGFGTTWDPISEDHSEHPFITSAKLLGPVGRKLLLFRAFIMPIVYKWDFGVPGFYRFLLGVFPSKSLHKLRDITDTMHSISLQLFNDKKEALAKGSGTFKNDHKDILSILMEANAKASNEDQLPDNEVIAQISTFTFAAMDTTSSALCRIFWLLARHQDVQDKLRAEIREAKLNFDEPNYDQLAGLPYLDGVCRETLRLYPPISTLARQTRKDVVLPLSKPVKTVDGKQIQEIHVPKDTIVFASLLGSNTNPELWGPDTYEWKPERWMSPLPDAVVEARIPGVYSHLMTFIGGGRACIGFKFSQMEMKAIIYVLIDAFKFSLPKQEILWTMGGLSTPSADPNQLKPNMPLVVSRAE
ncbi:hypothetical protein H1R20_g6706, partial [Candolleomyces eurysporus]